MRKISKLLDKSMSVKELSLYYGKKRPHCVTFLDFGCCLDTQPPIPPLPGNP